MKRRSLAPVAPAVRALAERLQPPTLLSAVQRAWPEAVGAAIAGEARPVAEREGTVRVLCSSSVWAQEIELLGPTLVEALNRALGARRVRAVKATATPGRLPVD